MAPTANKILWMISNPSGELGSKMASQVLSVSDTGPLNYLVQIGAESVLKQLFDTVLIPRAVFEELSAEGAPGAVRQWDSAMPDWCRVVELAAAFRLVGRHSGEREAIVLANQVEARFLLMDDRAGRAAARQMTRAEVVGTVGVLYQASLLERDPSLVRFSRWISRLRQTNFRISPALDAFLASKFEAGSESRSE
jgi:predicted nucleic acid-binding protein